MIEKFADEDRLAYLDKLEKLKTKILKYVMFKKRTEREVRQKFENEDSSLLEEAIEILKDLGYISDEDYIERFINESLSLKNLSIFELKYKMISKGIDKDLVETYVNNNIDNLEEYELKSAKNIVLKKSRTMEFEDIKKYLISKRYSEKTLKSIGE